MELGARFGLLEQLARNAFLLIKRTWQTYPIALATTVVLRKRLCMPSTPASGSTRFGVTSGSGQPTSIPNSVARYWLRRGQCCSFVEGEKRVVFFAILAVARMVIFATRKDDRSNFSLSDLILFFRVKIRCDRKRLDRITKGGCMQQA